MAYNDIKLTGVLEREAARMLVLTWLNEVIEVRQGDLPAVTQLFSRDDFGNIFNTLERNDVLKIKVTIEPVIEQV